MRYIRIDALRGHVQTFVASVRGSSAAELPRTTQDLELGETSRRTQASVSKPLVTPLHTTIASPFSGSTLHGDGLGEPSEKEQDGGSAQESKNADKEKVSLVIHPIAPVHNRRWGKPESYVIFNSSMKHSDGPRG